MTELPWWEKREEVYYLLVYLLEVEGVDWERKDVLYFLGKPHRWNVEYNKMKEHGWPG